MFRLPVSVAWLSALALACLALYYLANRAIYYPAKYPHGDWGLQQQLGAADVWMDTPDRVRLHGWWLPAPGSRFINRA